MDLGCENANNLISKNPAVSEKAARAIVDNKDIECFEKLCEKSGFLFDFIKDKINQNLLRAVNQGNYKNIFEFTKIYNQDYEPFVVGALLKFANEDMTDEVLELLENGEDEEKAYAAAYFYHINDPVCLEALNLCALSEFDPLAQNAARTLGKFGDRKLYNEATATVLDQCKDDFEKYKFVNFLTNFGDKEAADTLLKYLEISLTKAYAASSILYLKSFKDLIQEGKADCAVRIFDIIIEAYPEEISLETVFDFEIFDFNKYLIEEIMENPENSYYKRVLLKTKSKFNLVGEDDIYLYEISKEAKSEVQKIRNLLNTIREDLFKGLENELLCNDKTRAIEALNVILNYGKQAFSKDILSLVQNSTDEEIIISALNVLKAFGEVQNIDKESILGKIQNENILSVAKALFEN